jgi:mannitol/fructose-specific phosphotransferase system IIA component (Ntr-type)/CBS domain-containing protein
MKLSSLIDPRLVRCGLEARTKEEAFRELVELAVAETDLTETDTILDAVIAREGLGTTAVGYASAFPHTRCDAVDDFYAVVGTAPEGIDFASKDGAPVRFIVLLLITKTASTLYLKTIAALAQVVQQRELFERIVAAAEPEELLGLLDGSGVRVGKTLTLHDIMATELITVGPDAPLKEAVDLLFKHNVNALPVVGEDGTLLGAIEHLDIIASGIPSYLTMIGDLSFLPEFEPFEEVLRTEGEVAVRDLMCRDVPTVSEGTPLIKAAATMARDRLERLFVVRDGKLVGLVLAKYFIRKILRG